MNFTKITKEILFSNTILGDYLQKAKIIQSCKKESDVFVATYDVAPEELKEFGIVLPKGGMIIPNLDHLELKGLVENYILDKKERDLVAEKEKKMAYRKSLEDWVGQVNKEILPTLRQKLIHEIGHDCDLQTSFFNFGFSHYARITILGREIVTSEAGALSLEVAVEKLEESLFWILKKLTLQEKEEAFLNSPQRQKYIEIFNSYKHIGIMLNFTTVYGGISIYDRTASPHSLDWEDHKTWSIYNRTIVEEGVDVKEEINYFMSSEQLKEELEEISSYKEDRFRNQSRVSALTKKVKKYDLVLFDKRLEYSWYLEWEDCVLKQYERFVVFRNMIFYWNDKGVSDLEKEVQKALSESGANKEELRVMGKKESIEYHHGSVPGSRRGDPTLCGRVLRGNALSFVEKQKKK